jgi:hypothetical protein
VDALMIKTIVDPLYSKLLRIASPWTQGEYWLLKVTLAAFACGMFFAFPSYDALFHGDYLQAWQAVLEKTSNPLLDMSQVYGPGSHESKLTFRLVVPVVAHYLGLGVKGMVFLQSLAGVFILALSAWIGFQITRDRATALFTALLVAGTYAGSMAFVEMRGIFDGVAVLFLLLALSSKRFVLISVFIFLAAWTDERGLVAAALVFAYHALPGGSGQWRDWHTLLKPAPLAVIAGGLAYLVSRYILASYFDLTTATEGVGLNLLVDQLNLFPMGTWTALEGGWLLLILAAILLYRYKAYYHLFLVFIGVGAIIVVSMSVVDITRSMAYMIPVVFIAIKVVAAVEQKDTYLHYFVVAAIFTLLSANYYAGGEKTIWWQYPLPLQALRWIFIKQS